MVGLDRLPIEAALRDKLTKWADLAWDSDEITVQAQGLELFKQLRQTLGGQYEVIWDDN